MEKYNLVFKNKDRDDYWFLRIDGETVEEATKEAIKIISSRKNEIGRAYLEKQIQATEIVWEWESE